MNRYEIAMDFRNKFIKENGNVWSNSVQPFYFSINGDEIKKSTNPYSMEKAEHGLVIFKYTYTVVTSYDSCFATLFFNSNGEIEDYIEIDGWKLYFKQPITAYYRCDSMTCYMEKGPLKLYLWIQPWKIDNEFEKIWHLFTIVRTCNTQKEIDFAKKIYEKEEDILSIKEKDLIAEAKIDALEMLLDSYKELLDKLKEIVNTKSV